MAKSDEKNQDAAAGTANDPVTPSDRQGPDAATRSEDERANLEVQAQEAQAEAALTDVSGLEHSAGGRTTRDDVLDLGVPMIQGDPSEPQGPEDALGAGPTRGDYSERIGSSSYHPTTVVRNWDAKPGEPQVIVVEQRQFAGEVGDDPGVKGGVENDRFSGVQRPTRPVMP